MRVPMIWAGLANLGDQLLRSLQPWSFGGDEPEDGDLIFGNFSQRLEGA
jgi:hypothetical protein|tara:strand:- start:198 stop:344 length:147 start_codon:yes stop_codon:yes gene_type:complete